jgi:hypothetical protein
MLEVGVDDELIDQSRGPAASGVTKTGKEQKHQERAFKSKTLSNP